jgi:hypothetical protein
MSTNESTAQKPDAYQQVTDAIFSAASQAQKAADWLNERSGRTAQTREVSKVAA